MIKAKMFLGSEEKSTQKFVEVKKPIYKQYSIHLSDL